MGRKASPRHGWVWGLGLAGCLLAGCSMRPGSGVTLFPGGHRLIRSARELRRAAPEPWPLPRELDKHALPPYQVEPGDVLLVQPADLSSSVRLPGDQPVMPDGTINLGRYGRLKVAGMTVDEIEAAVNGLICPQTFNAGPMVVRVITRISKVYYVLGEVNSPGAFQLNGRETVLDALLAAGGLTDRGSRKNIILSRPTTPDGCRIVLPICYREIVQLGDTATNYQIAPGDRIFVPTRSMGEGFSSMCGDHHCGPCGKPQVPCPAPEPEPEHEGPIHAPLPSPEAHLPAGEPAEVPARELLPAPRHTEE